MEALWTQVRGRGRLFSYAEPGIPDRELGDNRAVRIGVAEHLFGAESPLVEGDRVRSTPDSQYGRDTDAKRHGHHSRVGGVASARATRRPTGHAGRGGCD